MMTAGCTCTGASRRASSSALSSSPKGSRIREAALDNGLLHINLVRHVPEPEVRDIEIKDGAPRTIDVEPE